MIRIRSEAGERAVTPEEFIDLVGAGRVRENDWICGETLTRGRWMRAGAHPFFEDYAFGRWQEKERFLDALFAIPPLTLTLIAINILVWTVMSAAGDWQSVRTFPFGTENVYHLIQFGAKENRRIGMGEYWRLLSCMFLHVNPLHLGLNSCALFLCGRFVENLYGKGRFLLIYFAAGLGGSLVSYRFAPTISAGASAAIYGLLGVLFVFTLRHYRCIPKEMQRIMRFLLVLVVIEIGIGFFWSRLDLNGHLGGLATGALLGWLMRAVATAPAWCSASPTSSSDSRTPHQACRRT
ncbi:MAG: rhomboid family intramembrane serine protease [Abditibacteriales bacterium]|nr:rhomboid family intramembrane serine protease [Abditibacteriales bacterium]MDW8368110.1 rhomboid family intramembrane serine protease [Abditibacteriales bacterium]